jgi:transcriptional regulator GlxA family with amidase domain
MRQIERLFERDMGMSPKRYYRKLRLERARDLLVHSSMPIVDVAIATGFISASHFAKTFKTLFGFTPSDARRGDSSLGSGQDAHGHFSNNDNGLPGLVVERPGQWASQ